MVDVKKYLDLTNRTANCLLVGYYTQALQLSSGSLEAPVQCLVGGSKCKDGFEIP